MISALLLALATTPSPSIPSEADPMKGKVRTDRTISVETTVDAPPAEVFRRWTTEDGIPTFFAPKARIDAVPGGRFEMLMNPEKDPEGLSHGTGGARVLKIVPDRELWFEWIVFVARTDIPGGPPAAPPEVRKPDPIPTWVELRLTPVDGGKRTRVTLQHFGFQHGPLWDLSYAYFQKAWGGVLRNLTGVFAPKTPA